MAFSLSMIGSAGEFIFPFNPYYIKIRAKRSSRGKYSISCIYYG